MDLDSVELLENISKRLEKIETMLNSSGSGSAVQEPETKPPILKLKNEYEYKYKYVSLEDLMNGMGLEEYIDKVTDKVKDKDYNLLYCLAQKALGSGLDKYAYCFLKTHTPRVYNNDGIIRIEMFNHRHRTPTIIDNNAKIIKQLIKYCFDEKYWNKLNIEIKLFFY